MAESEHKNSKGPRIYPKVKVWFESEDGYLIGEGRVALLRAVEKLGSLNKAAAEMNMSYRAAWGSIKIMEKRLGIALLEPERGGEGGGGSKLSPEAVQLVRTFESFSDKVHDVAGREAATTVKKIGICGKLDVALGKAFCRPAKSKKK
jgi:molybdate transport system regulatory protein